MGVEDPDLFISGAGTGYVLLLKTYLTKERLIIEKHFASNKKYMVSQTMWLTPEVEIEIDALRKTD